MKKISVKGNITDCDRLEIVCPYCGLNSTAVLFKTDTHLCLYSIPVKEIHSHYMATCLSCKHSFEVEKE